LEYFTLQYGGWGVKVTTSLHPMRSEAIPHIIYAFTAFTRDFFFSIFYIKVLYQMVQHAKEGNGGRYNRELEELYNEPNI